MADRDTVALTYAVKELRRAMQDQVRVLTAVNTNLVALGKILQENKVDGGTPT